ncbi:neutral zinc metallopeptidase [Nonomuraea sp. NPDC049637]|uniref:neutral zinc metallopeptidase n=1 Tax=Nonomuraea sp. NPDC049637 TaxID=3154356 RepID=UPI00342375C1
MKPLMILTMAGVLTASLAGTAAAESAAYPVKHPKLIANPLYEAGPLPTTTCAEPRVKRHNVKQARAYVDAVIACLETTWQQHLTAAGLPYAPVKVRHMDRIPKSYCGIAGSNEASQAWYCDKTRTLAFQIGKDWTDDPSDLWLLHTTASMYGYHVQNLVGVADAYDVITYRGKAEEREQDRRNHLQVACLSGAFIKSVWPLEGRSKKDWGYFLTLPNGDKEGKYSSYGKTATIRSWIKQGFATGDPGSCNTWAAASSKVL